MKKEKEKLTMAENHEFRHPTNQDTYVLVREIWKKYFNNLKWTGFLQKVFSLGLDKLKLQISQQNKK